MKFKYILLLLALSTQYSAAQEPNFILFYTDDLGYADTSVQLMDAEPPTIMIRTSSSAFGPKLENSGVRNPCY